MKHQRVLFLTIFNLALLVVFGMALAGTTKLRHYFSPVAEKTEEDRQAKERLSLRETLLNRRNAPKRRAHRAFYKGDFEEAVVLYTEVLNWDQTEDDGTLWFRYGYSLNELNKIEESLSALHIAVNFPRYRSESLYLLARMHADSGDTDAALDYLKRAADSGYYSQISIVKETEFETLLANEDFQKIEAQVQSNWEQFTSSVVRNYQRQYDSER